VGPQVDPVGELGLVRGPIPFPPIDRAPDPSLAPAGAPLSDERAGSAPARSCPDG
jgi:hypothetical protein